MLVPDWGDMIGLSLDNLIGLGLDRQAPLQRCVLGPEDARNCYQFQQQMNALTGLAASAGRSDPPIIQTDATPERDNLTTLLPLQAQHPLLLAGFASVVIRGPAAPRPNAPKPDRLKVAAEQELKEYLGVEELYDLNDPWAGAQRS